MKQEQKFCQKKECTYCHKSFPRTPEFFHFFWSRARGKKYPNPRCKVCSRKLDKEYRKANAEKFRETQRRWTQTPKGAYKSLKNSKARGHKVKIRQEKFVEWYKLQQRKCCYCGLEEKNLRLVSDAYNNRTFRLTVDRIDSSKDYVEGNLALCCLRCNHVKGDLFTQSEMEEIGKKFISLKWKNAIQH